MGDTEKHVPRVGFISASGKRAIIEALGLKTEKIKSLTLTVDYHGVHCAVEYLITDDDAQRAGEALRRLAVVESEANG